VIDTVTTGGVTAAQINTAFAAGTSVPFSNLGNSGLVGFPTSLTMTAALFESATAMGTGESSQDNSQSSAGCTNILFVRCINWH
jgi:hypothetical protein